MNRLRRFLPHRRQLAHARCASAPARRGRHRAASGGFTLVELLVSLMAGLVVAVAVMQLSREATNTFHEEMRAATAEMSLRTTMDRIRSDLQRAAYMGTGNILADTNVAKPQTAATGLPAAFTQLAGVRLVQGGSAAAAPLSAQQQPTALTPDQIQLAGNMTSADDYVVDNSAGASACGGPRITLASGTEEIFRLGSSPQASLQAMFQPVITQASMVRLRDRTGRYQFLQTCAANAVGVTGSKYYVDLASAPAIATAVSTLGAGGVAGFGEASTIAPIQIVRYRLGNLSTTAGFANLYGTGYSSTASKYDLIRESLDLTLAPVTSSQELIAEYVVDLRFGFTVDSGSLNTPSLLTFAFGDVLNQTWASAPSATPSTPGPQRIRSVRVRLATRSALPDRSMNLPPEALTGTTDSQSFRYRYCLNANGCGTVKAPQWARMRTLTTEVAIPNQMGLFY